MGAHPSGDGAAWDSLEAIDVDQPHGLDQRTINHIAIAVRKRIMQEHSEFGDTTAGGIHKPGGCAVLGMEITDTAGDPTALVVADGTYRGHGLVWSYKTDSTDEGVLFCATAAAGASTTGDWTVLALHPDRQWKGGDVTWAGAHEFDVSVDISTACYIDGSFEVLERMHCFSNEEIVGDLSVDGTAAFGGDVSIDGTLCVANFVCDGTAVVGTEFDVSGNADISGTLNIYKYSLDTTGYTYLSAGLIMQWSKDLTFGANQNREIAFPLTFPTAVWAVLLTQGDWTNPATYTNLVQYHDVSLEGMDIMNANDNTASISYLVLGN